MGAGLRTTAHKILRRPLHLPRWRSLDGTRMQLRQLCRRQQSCVCPQHGARQRHAAALQPKCASIGASLPAAALPRPASRPPPASPAPCAPGAAPPQMHTQSFLPALLRASGLCVAAAAGAVVGAKRGQQPLHPGDRDQHVQHSGQVLQAQVQLRLYLPRPQVSPPAGSLVWGRQDDAGAPRLGLGSGPRGTPPRQRQPRGWRLAAVPQPRPAHRLSCPPARALRPQADV